MVRVPAYIAIRVELRSGDGDTYALRFGDRTLRVDRTVALCLGELLRPATGQGPDRRAGVNGTTRVRVEATAEPGP